jgi:hypothetical protein
MRKLGMCAVAALAVCAAAVPAASGSSERRVTLDSYCSPTGDYCLEIKAKGNKVKLKIASLAFSGEYKLCVKGPETKKCGDFLLEPDGSGWSDTVNFNGVFGYEGEGIYKVVWKLGGQKLGKTLGFQYG